MINKKEDLVIKNKDLFHATVIASGGLSGGVGSVIAGGNFWKGVRQGLITAGLNHVAHHAKKGLENIKNKGKENALFQGAAGRRLAMYRLTGQARHLIAADAYAFSGTFDIGVGGTGGFEKGSIFMLQGSEMFNFYEMSDFGLGLSTPMLSLSLEVVELYFDGPLTQLTHDKFYGLRYELNIGADALGKLGFTGIYSKTKDGYNVYGLGATIGLDGVPNFIDMNINGGVTGKEFHNLRKYLK